MFNTETRAQKAINEMIQLNDILVGNAETKHLSDSTCGEIEMVITELANEIISYYDDTRKWRLEKEQSK